MNRSPEILDQLRAEIESAPAGERPAIIGQIAALLVESFASVVAPAVPVSGPTSSDEGDQLIDVDAAAAMLGMSSRWVREHQDELPRVNLPGSAVRFSSKRLATWVKKRSYG